MTKKTFVFCGLLSALLLFPFSSSRADFSWNQQAGPPVWQSDSFCNLSSGCIPSLTCTNCNVFIIIDGGSSTVNVLSYVKNIGYNYGLCSSLPEGQGGNCLAYPNARCGIVQVYGSNGCIDSLGSKTVYAGNCNP